VNRHLAWLVLLPLLPATVHAAAGTAPACKDPEAAPVRIRLGDQGPAAIGIDGRISGSERFGLELREARSGALLWTAGAAAGALLQVPAMDARILARPVPVDLDGDGWHDRIYAADAAGKIWRIELTNGMAREDWARAALLADLSGNGLRGFLAAPDIALHEAQGRIPWLSIALGSASFQDQPAANRFYVLRDSATAAPEDVPVVPIVDADLILSEGTQGIGSLREDVRPRGYYLPLGAAQVLAPSLTVGGVVVFTLAQATSLQAGGCALLASGMPARIEVRAVAAATGAPSFDLNADGLLDSRDAVLALQSARPADSTVRMAAGDAADTPGQRHCLIGNDRVPGCTLDTRLRRRYWLREDAD
jgi:Tfp pilus tip-associated adhesin PilY1